MRRAWRGHEVITCGPWCQGPALQEALALLERVGIAGLAHNSPTYLHRIAECVNLAMADREFSSAIRPSSTCRSITCSIRPPSRGEHRRCATIARSARCPRRSIAPTCRTWQPADLPKVEADTSYCCVVDRWGDAFSATPSDGSGNVPVVPGLGITPSGRGSRPARSAPSGRGRARQAAAADANTAMVVTEAGGVMPFGTRAATCRPRLCCRCC